MIPKWALVGLAFLFLASCSDEDESLRRDALSMNIPASSPPVVSHQKTQAEPEEAQAERARLRDQVQALKDTVLFQFYVTCGMAFVLWVALLLAMNGTAQDHKGQLATLSDRIKQLELALTLALSAEEVDLEGDEASQPNPG